MQPLTHSEPGPSGWTWQRPDQAKSSVLETGASPHRTPSDEMRKTLLSLSHARQRLSNTRSVSEGGMQPLTHGEPGPSGWTSRQPDR